MKYFFDSSAFAKRFIEEPGSSKVDAICHEASQLALSVICYPEIISALNRRLRERSITKKNYFLAKKRFSSELCQVQIIDISPRVILETEFLLENNSLRTLDALHLASALEWEADFFVTSDIKQGKAAEKMKLSIQFVD